MTLKIILVIIVLQCMTLGFLSIQLVDLKAQSQLLPEKIDLLVDMSQDKPVINLDCPKCPDCPECKDYLPDLQELKKAIKKNRNQSGVYYYYSGCQ